MTKQLYEINNIVDPLALTMKGLITDESTDDGTGLALFTDIIDLFRFKSTAQTITAAALIQLAHGLGIKPTSISGYIKATTAEHGYSIGDEVEVNLMNNSDATTSRCNGIYTDATNINIRLSDETSTFIIGHKTTGVINAITNSSWELYITAIR